MREREREKRDICHVIDARAIKHVRFLRITNVELLTVILSFSPLVRSRRAILPQLSHM